MTERSDDAPDPAAAPPGGTGPGPAPAAPMCWDLAAVRRSDAIMAALAARGAVPEADQPGSQPGPSGPSCSAAVQSDPAVRLLRALIADVDADACELPGPAEPRPPARRDRQVRPVRSLRPDRSAEDGSAAEPGQRRGPRTVVLLGIVGPLLTGVLATTGVAVAQDRFAERPDSGPGAEELAAGKARVRKAGRVDRPRPADAPAVRSELVVVTAGDSRRRRPVPLRIQRVHIRAHPHRSHQDDGSPDFDGRAPRQAPPRPDEPRDGTPEPHDAAPFLQPEPHPPGTEQDPPAPDRDTPGTSCEETC